MIKKCCKMILSWQLKIVSCLLSKILALIPKTRRMGNMLTKSKKNARLNWIKKQKTRNLSLRT